MQHQAPHHFAIETSRGLTLSEASRLLHQLPRTTTSPQSMGGRLKSVYNGLDQERKNLLGAVNIPVLSYRINKTADFATNLTRLTMKHDQMAAGRLFHQQVAGLQARKHDPLAYQYLHDLKVAEYFIRIHRLVTGNDPDIADVNVALNHEVFEDYDVRYDRAARFLGTPVADGIMQLTNPTDAEMLRLYAAQIRSANPTARLNHKVLKDHHQLSAMTAFDMPTTEIKIIDSLEGVRGLMGDLRSQRLFITNDAALAKDIRRANVLLADDMWLNLEQRENRCQRLLNHANDIADDPVLNKDGVNAELLTDLAGVLFKNAFADWRLEIRLAAATFDVNKVIIQPRRGLTLATPLRPKAPRRQTATIIRANPAAELSL